MAGLFTLSTILIATLLFLNHYSHTGDHENKLITIAAISSRFQKAKYPPSVRPIHKNLSHILLLILLLAGDIESNPGPVTRKTRASHQSPPPKLDLSEIFPCALCDRAVNWSDQGVCCDQCSMWHHKSCIELCSKDFSLLNRSNVSWICCKCDCTNLSSFTFHSFSIGSNSFYHPIQDESVDGSVQSNFSPLKASTPEPRPRGKETRTTGSGTPSSQSLNSIKNISQDDSHGPTKKETLRIMNINAQSIRGKTSELTALLDYCKPDIVCCTETWLGGKKPGENPAPDAIQDSELFPHNYKSYRMTEILLEAAYSSLSGVT